MFEKQIAAGMEWLDRHAPGWEHRINLEELDLSECFVCVLGQVFGEYMWAADRFKLERDACNRMGFTLLGDNSWCQLTAEWRAAIRTRRSRPKGGRVTVLRLPRFACDPIREEVLR